MSSIMKPPEPDSGAPPPYDAPFPGDYRSQCIRLIHVFGETLEKWDESVTLCSSKLMRGGIDANNALIAATGWSRHHRNQ